MVGGYGDNTFQAPGATDKTEDSGSLLGSLSRAPACWETAFGLSVYVPWLVDWGRQISLRRTASVFGTMTVMDITPISPCG